MILVSAGMDGVGFVGVGELEDASLPVEWLFGDDLHKYMSAHVQYVCSMWPLQSVLGKRRSGNKES